MPPIRTKRERTSSVQPVNIDPQWSDGDFSLISKDGTTFKVPSYHLQSASTVFRDMLLAGDGPKEVTLEARAVTIGHFLQMVRSGKPTFTEIEDFEYMDQVVELAAFLDKYQCDAALYMFFHFIRTIEPVAPLLLFMVGVRLQRPRVCSEALDQSPQSWQSYCRKAYSRDGFWKTPKFVQDFQKIKQTPPAPVALDSQMLLPQAIPCSLFLSLPPEYAWALAAGAFYHNNVAQQCSGAEFLMLVKVAQEARALAEDTA